MNNNFIYQGRKSYKKTKEYRRKKFAIIKKVNEKFDELINNEKNIFRKLILILNKKKHLKRQLEILDSKEILFTSESG